MKTIIYSKVD